MRLSFNRYNHEREVTIQPSMMMFELLPWEMFFCQKQLSTEIPKENTCIESFFRKKCKPGHIIVEQGHGRKVTGRKSRLIGE